MRAATNEEAGEIRKAEARRKESDISHWPPHIQEVMRHGQIAHRRAVASMDAEALADWEDFNVRGPL